MRADPTYESFTHRHHSYTRRGHYADQLEQIFGLFPREQVHVMDSEAFFARPAQEYHDLTEFLGLQPFQPASFGQHNARPGTPMAPGTQRRLEDHFAPHNKRLAALLELGATVAPLTGRAQRATGRGGYVRETLGVLWPEPARITRTGRAAPFPHRRDGRAEPGQVRAEFIVLPNESRGAAAAAAAAAGCGGRGAPLQGFRGRSRRLLFRGLALAARAGLADLLPHRIAIEAAGTGPDTDVAAYLNAALGLDVVVSLRIGRARATASRSCSSCPPTAGWWASPRSG